MSQQDSSQQGIISAYFVLFCFLLAVVLILSNVLHHHPRVAAMFPEAGMILSVGVLVGAMVQLVANATGNNDGASQSTYYDAGAQNNNNAYNDNAVVNDDDTDAAANSSAVATASLFSFSPELFFLVWLPPIIFNSGFHLRKELFFRHFTPICLLAVVGTTVSSFIIAGVLQLAFQYLLTDSPFQPHVTELLTFGALLSATDPVTTLAVFQQKRVDPQLFYLVFGEIYLSLPLSNILNPIVITSLIHSFKFLQVNPSSTTPLELSSLTPFLNLSLTATTPARSPLDSENSLLDSYTIPLDRPFWALPSVSQPRGSFVSPICGPRNCSNCPSLS